MSVHIAMSHINIFYKAYILKVDLVFLYHSDAILQQQKEGRKEGGNRKKENHVLTRVPRILLMDLCNAFNF